MTPGGAPALRETLRVESVAPGGAGIARRANGQVVFVPGSLPGELLDVEILRERGRFAEGRVAAVLEASPHRTAPVCQYFGSCGGCQLQHASYEYQLELKRGHVEETLARIGKLPGVRVLPTLPSPLPWGYRNRIAIHSDGRSVGLFAASSRRVIDIESCPIASASLNAQLAEVRAGRRAWEGTRVLREPSAFRGFRQVNDAAADILLREVLRRLEPGGHWLVESFCGGGFFTMPAARLFQKITAIEWSAQAVRAARRLCPPHVEIVEADARLALPEILSEGRPDMLLLDPPATGLDPRITEAIRENAPERVVYVSCDPATFARDVGRLAGQFTLEEVQPVDMFPQTAHIECVGLLRRRNISG